MLYANSAAAPVQTPCRTLLKNRCLLIVICCPIYHCLEVSREVAISLTTDRQPVMPGRVAQLVGHLTRKSEVLGSIPGLATYFRFYFRFLKNGSCQLLAKVCAPSTVNRLGGLSLPRKSVVRLTDRPDMTLDVYRGRKTTIQQQQQPVIYWATIHLIA